MKEEGVAINDLSALMLPQLKLAAGDMFHWKPEGRDLQVKAVADALIAPDIESRIAQAAATCRANPGDHRCKTARQACARASGIDPSLDEICRQLAPWSPTTSPSFSQER
jgi:hypothetical protein